MESRQERGAFFAPIGGQGGEREREALSFSTRLWGLFLPIRYAHERGGWMER